MVRTLYFWVIVGVIAGALLGHFAPDTAVTFKPLGDIFIKLIKMMIAPVIFCTVVLGIAGMRNLKNAGRVGLKSLLYFEGVSTLALVIGLVVINIAKPGEGMNIDPATLDTKSVESYSNTAAQQGSGVVDFLTHIIPTTIADAFTTGNILQVLLVALLFACAVLSLGNKSHHIVQLVQEISDILFKMIRFIVMLAPLGAFGAMAFTVGKYGVEALTQLAELMLCFYITCALFIAIVLGALMRAIGLRLWPLLCYLKEELFIVLGTSSSETVLPRLIEKMEKVGCSKSVVGMVVPTGYSFNLDGTAIYLTMATVFLSQALNMHLSFLNELTILGVLLLTSKGAAGVTGSGFVVLAGTLATVGHIPVESIALILGIDRFMSEARAVTNFIGNAVATLVVSKWENALDMPTAKKALDL